MPSGGQSRSSRRCNPASSARRRSSGRRYKPDYERYLRPQPLTDEAEEQDKLAVRETSAQAEQRSAGDDQTGPVAEASEPASDQRPTDADEATVPERSEAIGESDLQPSEEISS